MRISNNLSLKIVTSSFDNKGHEKEKIKEKQRGVTLIVLVITIIILLILAGITIGTITGENGIIGNAGNVKEETEIANEKEIVNTATVQTMGNNKYGNIEEDELQEQLDKITDTGKTNVQIIRRKLIVEFTDSHRMYHVDDNGNVYEYTYTDLPLMEYGSNFNNRMNDYKYSILTVTVLDNINIPENVYKIFDVSKNQDETVKAWLITNSENADMYDLYIGGEEGVEIENCSDMFREFSGCTNINIENLYTEKVQTFDNMFNGDAKLLELIASPTLVTSKATSLQYMFYLCTKLKSIDTNQWDTSNVINMFGTFRMCQNIEVFDLSNFDTSKVVYIDYLFQHCQKLKTIYVSNKWNNNKVTSSYNMFQGCTVLKGAISFNTANANDITLANYETGYFTFKNIE